MIPIHPHTHPPIQARWKIIAAGVLLALFAFAGCNSYITRIVSQSLGRIGETIPSPPHMIATPYLPNANLAVAWAGHATMVIQIHDKIIVTDPLLTNTLGMVVKRYVKTALDPSLLPKVDATIVSHIHFDHFSYGSLDMLPKGGILTIPLGAADYTPDLGFRKVVEMKPWQMVEEDGLKITAVPVQHFTGRYGFDAAWLGTLGYTGYIIQYKEFTVFFAGDTGYNPEMFKEIGRRYSIDLALIPIAPGSSYGLGSYVHVNPRGALEIFKDVHAKYMVPMHFGTLFYGPTTNPNESLDLLRSVAASEHLSDKVIGLEMGEQRVLF
ncbi:MAG TPA: MBL fold metallo-hydrolase [Bacteroidota bacterium]|nr:MBL fold metallo-hydrolase [Bacteroidota bacterium]